ncbi:hypothetical protein P7B02_03785 [Caulobacter segnis]|uniref:hypothetical protein n=1 Tax=Caulobacter segnis TaxID=88688 RepID=UPI0024106DF9|nr:hypothetical protein [Caulobacter segnis]MDG2520653.1 hypothetical protein [Caulobacter segnis]
MTDAERESDIDALIAATPNLVAEINAVKEVVRRLAALAARDEEARSFLAQPVGYGQEADPEAETLARQVSEKISQIVGAAA